MDIIHLLPDSVANQIAAGEVIQRPASCLKELVENSLDAGATMIHVLLYDSGRTMMQVIDNGKGMSETDARMAFERHATSKIQSAQDLFALRTMGFRGEALASICAVAHVELQTRRPEDEIGTRLVVAGSVVEEQEPCQCAVGTNFKVKNLFFNVPARRRFLKTDATELRNIQTEFFRIALVNPQCQFTLTNNDAILFELPVGTYKQRIEQVFGKSVNKQFTAGLVEISTDTELVSIRGFIGKPDCATKTPQQYFFVNNRYMRHPYFHKAVQRAYEGMLSADYSPSYFIYFDIDPELIDVNIHPTKTEIKFSDEQAIWQILQATIREALGKFNVAPSLDFDVPADVPDIPVAPADPSDVHRPDLSFDPSYNPFRSSGDFVPQWGAPEQASTQPSRRESDHGERTSSDWQPARRQNVSGWESLYTQPSEVEETDDQVLFDDDLSALTPYQYASRYIILPVRKGLMLIDQHRAHVCVLYAQLQMMLAEHRGVTQQLLFPEVIDLTPDEMSLMQQVTDDLRWVGFEVDQFGPTSYSINGVPAILGEESAVKTLHNILSSVRESQQSARDEWRDRIARSLAEDTAIRAGRLLSEAEMRDLTQRLFALDQYATTPAGRPVMAVIARQDIDRLF